MIAVFSADRDWRLRVERQLKAQGVAVRIATRPAELAKCLADGAVGMVIAGVAADDARLATSVVTAHPLICTAPGEPIEAVVRRAMERL